MNEEISLSVKEVVFEIRGEDLFFLFTNELEHITGSNGLGQLSLYSFSSCLYAHNAWLNLLNLINQYT